MLAIALGLYLYGIYYAIFLPDEILDTTRKIVGYKIPDPLDTLVSAIGAVLLTNFGAVLGIAVTQPQSAMANKALFQADIKNITPPLSNKELLQLISVLVYLVTILACFVTWAYWTFKSDKDIKPVVPFIQQYGKTLIGVVAAYLATIIGGNN